jgi:hypothetical protein
MHGRDDNSIILIGKSEVIITRGRPRRRWEGVIAMNIREIGWGDVDCIRLVQDWDQWWPLLSTKMNLLFHKKQNFLTT